MAAMPWQNRHYRGETVPHLQNVPESQREVRCHWCDGVYIQDDGPDFESYAGYAHTQDCGVLVFADALAAELEAMDAAVDR